MSARAEGQQNSLPVLGFDDHHVRLVHNDDAAHHKQNSGTDSIMAFAMRLMAALSILSGLLAIGQKGCVLAPDEGPNPAYAHELPEIPIPAAGSGLHDLTNSAAGLTAASRSQSGIQRSLHLASRLLGQAAQGVCMRHRVCDNEGHTCLAAQARHAAMK